MERNVDRDSGVDPRHRGKCLDEILDGYLEAGKDVVDLSGLKLQILPAGSMTCLKGLIKHQRISDGRADEKTYGAIEPNLQLYLAHNLLTNFPPDILDFSHLQILSLRHNDLSTIPSSIGNIPNLMHLHVGFNKLRYLPFEILKLYTTPGFCLVAYPNPMISPVGGSPSDLAKVSLESMLHETFPLVGLWKRTKPTFFRADGSQIRDSQLYTPYPKSRVPSLRELALRGIQDSTELADLKEWCEKGEGPPLLVNPVQSALDAKTYGRNKCTICQREFVICRVEWIDFCHLPWNLDHIIPFLRQGCSWACVLEADPEKEVLLAEGDDG